MEGGLSEEKNHIKSSRQSKIISHYLRYTIDAIFKKPPTVCLSVVGSVSHLYPVSLPQQPSKSEAMMPHSKKRKVSLGKGGDSSEMAVPTEIRSV